MKTAYHSVLPTRVFISGPTMDKPKWKEITILPTVRYVYRMGVVQVVKVLMEQRYNGSFPAQISCQTDRKSVV